MEGVKILKSVIQIQTMASDKANIHVGPKINANVLDNIETQNSFICCNCSKKVKVSSFL